jgi:hypothetical protein
MSAGGPYWKCLDKYLEPPPDDPVPQEEPVSTNAEQRSDASTVVSSGGESVPLEMEETNAVDESEEYNELSIAICNPEDGSTTPSTQTP